MRDRIFDGISVGGDFDIPGRNPWPASTPIPSSSTWARGRRCLTLGFLLALSYKNLGKGLNFDGYPRPPTPQSLVFGLAWDQPVQKQVRRGVSFCS